MSDVAILSQDDSTNYQTEASDPLQHDQSDKSLADVRYSVAKPRRIIIKALISHDKD